MLKLMRDSFQHLKWVLVAIVAAFIFLIFVDWGAGGAGRASTTGGYAARVNGEMISLRDYSRALYYAEENYKRMYGGQFTPEMAQQMGLPRQVLDSLVDQRLMLQEAARLHLAATPEEIRKRILTIPILAPDGKFVGTDLYEQYVRQLGFNGAADFEQELAREITLQKVESAMTSSVVVSPKAAEAEYKRNSESAQAKMVVYSGARELANVSISRAEVEEYYKANQAKYSHGEQRNLKYLVADLARIRSQIAPTEAELRKRYELSKETDFKRPEQAHVLHILIKVESSATPQQDAEARAKAESIIKQLRAGGDFAALAKTNSQDPSSSGTGGDMGWVDRGSTVPLFDTAVFTAPLNKVIDPIRSAEYGYHIVKVLERRPAGFMSFEETRGTISSQLVSQLSAGRATEEITKISAQIQQKKPASGAEFSAFANDRVSSNETQWFAKGESIPGLGSNEPLAAWAFDAKLLEIGDIAATRRGPAMAMLIGIRPAGTSPLDEIRPRVEADAKAQKAAAIATQKLAAAMVGATSIDEVAKKVGVAVQDATINRQGTIAGLTGDTSALTEAALAAPVGQIKGPVAAADAAVAFVVVEQKKATPEELAKSGSQYAEVIRQRESRSLRMTLLNRLRKASQVEINEEAIKQTRGSSQGA